MSTERSVLKLVLLVIFILIIVLSSVALGFVILNTNQTTTNQIIH